MLMIFFFLILFLLYNNPILMIINLITLTLLLCLMITKILTLSWFSYMLVIILLGAMLIIFIYMASLAPNEKLSKLMHPFIFFIPFIFIPLLFFSQKIYTHLLCKYSVMMTKMLFFYPPFMLNFTTAIFLLLTMIGIVKITSITQGPMKSN